MGMSVALYRKLERVTPELRDALLSLFEEVERNREEAVTKREFNELKDVVRELAEAQMRMEARLDRLSAATLELAEAQKRTEARLEELAEAQKKTEARLDSLTLKVEELAEAQKRTEARLDSLTLKVEELAEAQKRTEARVEELAEAQKRTEKEVASLARGLKATREQVGGLSRSVAYALENEAYRKLPAHLAAVHGIQVVDRIIRADVADEEINFFARARKDDKPVVLVGESVLRLDDASKLKSLRQKLEKVRAVTGEELLPIIVTHYAKPKVLEKAREAGILVIQSFEWD
uniref:Chordopoxvirus fusion protein n=1 Tax=Desulfacinum infernum TaxID=35837 RepID=A0A832EEN3_9BACT